MVDWKKEYKAPALFGRNRGAQKAAEVAAPDEPQAPATEPARSFLKQEIHLFGGRSKAPNEASQDESPPAELSQPWYKKEVSLKKSKAADPGPDGEPSLPWYKKDVSLKRKPAPEPGPEAPLLPPVSPAPPPPVQLSPPAPEPVVEHQPTLEPVAEVQPEPAPVVRAIPEPGPEPEPQPVFHVVPEPIPAAEAEPDLESGPPVSWVDAMLEPHPPAPEPTIEPAPGAEPTAAAGLPAFPPPPPAPELPAFPPPAPAAELPAFPPPAAVAELPAFPPLVPTAEPPAFPPPAAVAELPAFPPPLAAAEPPAFAPPAPAAELPAFPPPPITAEPPALPAPPPAAELPAFPPPAAVAELPAFPPPAPVSGLPAFPPPAAVAELPAFPPPLAAAEPPAFAPPAAVAELPAFTPPAPEPAAEPESRAVHSPVTAEELSLLPSDGDRQSPTRWYKRELSLGRKPKEKEPYEPDAPKLPFWKKELSLGRKPKEREQYEPDAPKVPFWKKDLSRGRGAKAPKPNAAAVEAAPAVAKAKPFWKKEFSLGRSAGKDKAPQEANEVRVKPEKAASRPFWKRDFSPTFSLPLRGSGGKGKGGSVPKQLVGLKIGASQLAAARVSNNGHAEVLQLARQPLDHGVIVGGELRDPEALAEALKDFFNRNKLPKRGVRLGIANNRIGVRTFEIGGIDDPKQLTNAIRFRAQEALPIPLEEAVLDYQVLEETVNDAGEKVHKILLVVAYRELVDRYVAACRKAGITLVGIDLEAFALLRALAAPREEDTDKVAVVAVAVGHDRSTFAVSDGRVCEFTRVLEWGGQNLNIAIARALDVTPSEAEPIKRLLSLDEGPAPEGITAEHFSAARGAAVGQVNTFARELVSSLQFYQSQPGSLGIGEIIITGGTAHLGGFAAQLQRLIGVKVRIGDPLVRVKVPKRFQEPAQIGSLTVAIGLGIED